MSLLQDMGFLVAEKLGLLLHALATSWLSAVLSTVILLVVLLLFWGVARAARKKLSKEMGVPQNLVSFGPAYAWAAKVILGLGMLHLVALVFGWFSTGPDSYGLQGEFLTRFSLDELVPVPFLVGFPVALGFYGYLFLVFFRARVETDYRLSAPVLAWASAILVIPLLPIPYLFQLFWSAVVGLSRKFADKKEKDGGDGDADAVGKPRPKEALVVAPPVVDGKPEWSLKVGHERRQLITAADGADTGADGRRLPHVYRQLPRFRHAFRHVGVGVFGALLAACFLPVLSCPSRLDIDLPDPDTVKAYTLTVSARGSEVPLLSARPFDISVPGKDGKPGTNLPSPRVVLEDESHVEYFCSGETKTLLRTALDEAELEVELKARLLLNYHLCDTFLDPFSAAKEALHDLWTWDPSATKGTSERLRIVTDAARELSATDAWGRAFLFAAIIHWENHRIWDAANLLRRGLEIGLEKSEEGEQVEGGFDQAFEIGAFLPTMALANVLARMNRFGEADRVIGHYVEQVEKWTGKGGEPDADRMAFLSLVQMHEALYLAKTFKEAAAARRLQRLRKRLEGETGTGRLKNRVEVLAKRLEQQYTTSRARAEVHIFGPLPAGVLSALLLFALGMLMSLLSPHGERLGKPARGRPRPGATPKPPPSGPGIAVILSWLQRKGAFNVSVPFRRSAAGGVIAAVSGAENSDNDGVGVPDRSAGSVSGGTAGEIETVVEKSESKESRRSLSETGRPVVAFVRELLRDRGRFGGADNERLYGHQEAALERLDEMRAHVKTEQQSGTVLLVAGAKSGRSTTALVASMEAIVELGQTVLYVCADATHMAERAGFFNQVRTMESWSWNMNAMVGGGEGGVDGAVTRELPIHLLFGTPDTVHRALLPQHQQHRLYGFLRNLGLIVIEDLHRFRPAALAHSSFIFRRLSEVLNVMGRTPVSLVTMAPIMSNDEDFVRRLLGPVAGYVGLVPEEADDAPNPVSHDIYVLQQADPAKPAYPECSPPHVVAALVQAAGVVEATDSEGVVLESNTWPACLVGYEDDVAKREDRTLRIYGELGVRQALSLAPLHCSRASIFPLTASRICELEARTRHGGISAQTVVWENDDFLSEGGHWVEPVETPVDEPGRHSTFLITGPEPVDRFLADRVERYALYASLGGDSDRFAEVFYEQRPLWTIPRRNRSMNKYHLFSALRERPSPGQRLDFLDDVFETDLLEEMLDEGLKKRLVDRQVVPSLERKRLSLKPELHYWSPRDQSSVEELYLHNYTPELVWVVDRVSHRKLFRVERCRVRTVYFPGRVFVFDGVRMQVRPAEHQDGFERDEWYVTSVQYLAHRTSRIRLASVKPHYRRLEVRRHAYGSIASETLEFIVACGAVDYREEVLGRRHFGISDSVSSGKEHCQPQVDSYQTEAVIFGFPTPFFGERADEDEIRAVLQGATLILRQSLPLVLYCLPDDVEVIFGTGESKDEWAGLGSDFRFTGLQSAGPVTEDYVPPLPFIAFVDRMAEGLGYARVAYDSVFQGELVRGWMKTALRVALWAQRHPGRRCSEVFETSHNVEEVDSFWEPFDVPKGSEPGERAELPVDEAVADMPSSGSADDGGDDFAVEGVPETDRDSRSPEPGAFLLTKVIDFLSKIVALSAAQVAELHSEDWLEHLGGSVVSIPEGFAAKRGALDPMGIVAGEDALASLLLPEWSRESDCPWAVAFLCALRAGTSDQSIRGELERLAMACLALRRRETDEDSWAPPVGRAELSRYRPAPDSMSSLSGVPYIGVPSADGTVLGAHYGELGEKMGLFAEGGLLTQRGCALARSLHTEPRFRTSFKYLLELTRPAGNSGEVSLGDLADGLCRRDLPVAARRILADGMSQVPSVTELGPLWMRSLRNRYQPQRIDGQLRWLEANARADAQVPQEILERFLVAAALHSFDRGCRTLVAAIRTRLTSYVRLGFSDLARALTPVHDDLVTPIAEAAATLLASKLARKRLPSDLVAFAREAERVPLPPDGAPEGASVHFRAEHIVRTVVRRVEAVSGAKGPLRSVGEFVEIRPGWHKKRPVDNSRGLLFRLSCLGNFLSETLWSDSVPPLGLTSDPVEQCDIDEPLPEKYHEPMEPPMPVGEVAEPEPKPVEGVEGIAEDQPVQSGDNTTDSESSQGDDEASADPTVDSEPPPLPEETDPP